MNDQRIRDERGKGIQPNWGIGRRWQWDTLRDHVTWEETGMQIGIGTFRGEEEEKTKAFIFFPSALDRSKKIKVDVLACGSIFHVLKMVDCAGITRFVVKSEDEAHVFDNESETMLLYHQREKEWISRRVAHTGE